MLDWHTPQVCIPKKGLKNPQGGMQHPEWLLGQREKGAIQREEPPVEQMTWGCARA